MKLKQVCIIPRQLRNSNGLTLMGLIASVICLFIVLTVASFLLWKSKNTAYEITVKYDLQNLIEAQRFYLDENNEYMGLKDDFFCSKLESEKFGPTLDYFTPSPSVVITVISEDPFIVWAKHKKSETVFEYNFNNGTTIKRGDTNEP